LFKHYFKAFEDGAKENEEEMDREWRRITGEEPIRLVPATIPDDRIKQSAQGNFKKDQEACRKLHA
jgi:hypothetical protein